MNTAKTCAIIGAGMAGLSTAAALLRLGWSVQIFERREQSELQAGALVLWPLGIQALNILGVDTNSICREIRKSSAWDFQGNLLQENSTTAMTAIAGGPLSFAFREDLLTALAQKIPAGSIHYGVRVSELDAGSEANVVWLDTGENLSFDLTVVADGVFSKFREKICPQAKLATLPYFGLVGCVDLDNDSISQGEMVEFWDGPRRVVLARGKGESFMFKISCHVEDKDIIEHNMALEDARFFALHCLKDNSSAVLQQLKSALADPDRPKQLYVSKENTLENASNWSVNQAVLIGDAAHAMTPALGQGANQSFMDALSLASSLSRSQTIPAALEEFQSKRLPEVQSLSKLAQLATESFTS